MAALDSGAQEADGGTSPGPATVAVKANAADKSASVAVNNSQLIEKLKAAGANLSPPVLEIVKMSDAGADSAVIQAYVENSPNAYNPKADEIIYLHDHGISTSIITAMIQHGAKLREQGAAAQANLASQPAQPPPPPTSPTPYAVQRPGPAYVASPGYVYPEPAYYPDYAYTDPGYYAPYASFGFFWPFYCGRSYYGHSFGGHFGHSFGGGAHFSRTFGSGRSSGSFPSSGHSFSRR